MLRAPIRIWRSLFVTSPLADGGGAAVYRLHLVALSTGFWLTWRLAYVAIIGVPVAYVWSRLNLRGLEVVARPQRRPPAGGRPVRGAHHGPQQELARRRSGSKSTTRARCPATRRSASSPCRRAAKKTWRARSTIKRRGLYSVGPVEVTTGDPFGLFRHTRDVRPRAERAGLPAGDGAAELRRARRRTCPARGASAGARTT